MARLVLKFKDKVLKEYQFKTNISIGRVVGNDIVIDNTAVSGRHAAIEVIDKHFILKDLGSKNGVFVNEKKVQEYELKEGDNILVGKHILEFDFGSGGVLIGSRRQEEAEMGGMTMCLDTRQYKELIEGKAVPPPKAAEPPPPKASVQEKPKAPAVRAKILMESHSTGRPTEIFIEKEVSIIGKRAGADILIHGFLCGDVAATVERKKDRFFIRHRGGFSKTKVNGETLQGAKVLSDGDEIKIGGNNLVFREML